MIFTTFGNAVIIQQVQLQNAQKTYQMKEKDCVIIMSDFFSKFLLKKFEKLGVEKLIFSVGGVNPPLLILKGLRELGKSLVQSVPTLEFIHSNCYTALCLRIRIMDKALKLSVLGLESIHLIKFISFVSSLFRLETDRKI